MSDDTLKFDLTDLYMTAPAFQRAGGGIANTNSRAQSTLMGMGAFWGNDDPGTKFGAKYEPAQDELLQLIAIIAGQVEGISDAINKMAANYGITEQANVNKMRALTWEDQ
jgi:hypothetical protein